MKAILKGCIWGCVAVVLVAGCEEKETSESPGVPERRSVEGYAKQESPSAKVDSKGKWWETENTKLKREIDRLKREIDSLKSDRDKAVSAMKSAKDERMKLIEERDEAMKKQKKSKMWLGVVLGTIAGAFAVIVAWLGFALLQKPKEVTSTEAKESCPRCGMKRTPGETVCRECGTHF